MANVYAVKTGNWSDATVWNTGALPTTADDVFSNNFTVTIDQNVTVLSIRNTAASPAVAGGTFTLTGNFTVECTGSGIINGTVTVLTYNGTGTATIKSNILGPTGVSSIGVTKSGTGTLNIVGNITSNANDSKALNITGAGTVNITGSLIGSGSTVCVCVFVNSSNVTLNITGDILVSVGYGILNSSAVSNLAINITGNVTFTGGSYNAIGFTSSGVTGTLIIVGNVSTTISRPAIDSNCLILVGLTGTITASGTSPAVSLSNAIANLNLDNAILINSATRLAVSATIITLTAGSNFRWQFYNKTVSGFVNLYPAGVALGNPAASNVRNGTTYGPSLELTGTLAVPPAGSVLLGVPTDNTTGTYSATAAAIAAAVWDKQTSELTTVGSIGERTKNTSTVASTAAQLAAMP